MKTNFIRKWLLAAGLLIVAVSVHAVERGMCGDNLGWTLDRESGLLVISGQGDMAEGFNEGHNFGQYWDVIKTVVIEDGVTSISDYAFASCANITTVLLPGGIKTIGNYAFRWCKSLVSINMPLALKSIGEGAFVECPLTSVAFPEGLGYIGEGAFRYTKLTSVRLPSSLKNFGNNAFESCYDLTTVVLSEGMETTGEGTFAGCSKLSSLTLPSTLKEIGSSAFLQCAVQSLSVPEGVTTIGEYAFQNSSLTMLKLPSTLESIGGLAFNNCWSLGYVVCLAVNPPTCNGNLPFGYNHYTLAVPFVALDAYKNASYWNSFQNIIPITVEATIGSTGYSTLFVADYDLNIPEGVKAYTGVVMGEWVSLTEVKGKIPAGTAVILKGAVGNYQFYMTTGAMAVGDNDLMGITEAIEADGTQYVLAEKDGVVGFYQAEVGTTIPAGKAYIEYTGASVKGFAINFDSETAIETPTTDNGQQTTGIYDLSGRRVEKATKGMYIINGKKVLK